MGKDERTKVEIKERNFVDIYNKEEKNSYKFLTKKDIEINHILSNKLKMKYIGYSKAIHIGNKYGESLGDVQLISDNNQESIFLELKYLTSKSSSGTRANISQNALTDYCIFENTKSWSDFRTDRKHYDWVIKEFSKYKNFKLKYDINNYKVSHIHKLAKELKDSIEKDIDKEILLNIKDTIIKMDAKEKIDYIEYLSERKINKINLKKFAILILTGNHTRESFIKYADINPNDLKPKGNYAVIYIYDKNYMYVENIEPIINSILKDNIDIDFLEGQTNIKIFTGNKYYILRIVFHWKNKFQGIQTPCLNIFDEFDTTLTKIPL